MHKINNEFSPDSKVHRFKSIDLLRGLAVIFMLQFHFANVFVIRSHLEPIAIIHYLGIISAPIFLTVVGISVVLSVNNRKKRGESEEEIKTHIITRALIIIVLHFLLSSSIFGLHTIWGWGILSLIGVSIIIAYALTKCSAKTIWICAFGVVIISPFLRVLLNYQIDAAFIFNFQTFLAISKSDNVWAFLTLAIINPSESFLFITTYSPPWDILAFIRAVLVTPGFPTLPHLFFVILGVWLGNSILTHIEHRENNSFLKKTTILGIIFLICGLLLEATSSLYTLTPADQMVGNTGYNLWTMGIVFLCFVFFYWIQDIKGKNNRIFNIITFFGDISLTILFIHAFFGWYILPILGGPNNISLFSQYIISLAFYCTIWILGSLWKKYKKFKYSLKWIIGNLS